MTPALILDILAALMLVVAAVSAARLGLATPWRKGAVVTDTDVSHLFMGIAMAGMLVSGLTTLPHGAWEVIFALLTVWFGSRVPSGTPGRTACVPWPAVTARRTWCTARRCCTCSSRWPPPSRTDQALAAWAAGPPCRP